MGAPWAVKRGMVATNPFANLPVAKSIGKRERVLTDDEIGGSGRLPATPDHLMVRSSAC
jgi:hypothetical protein